jgi:ComF family protein
VLLRVAINALSSVLFPAPCRICETTLTAASRIPICGDCLEAFQKIEGPKCQCCGRPFLSPVAGQAIQPLCRLCRIGFFSFERARSYAVYDDALAGAVVLLKYEGVKPLGEWFAARLAEAFLREGAEWKPDLVIPVPLHADRLRERGYNQAELIAKPLAKRLGVRFGSYLLVRTKPRPPRLVLSRTERWSSVRGAYAIRAGTRVDKLRILLIDDVLTTGATLDACSRALRKAGAEAVFGLTVARVAAGLPSAGQKADSRGSSRETVGTAGASVLAGEVFDPRRD